MDEATSTEKGCMYKEQEDAICQHLSGIVIDRDNRMLAEFQKQNDYLKINIEAILQGNKDIKQSVKTLSDQVEEIKILVSQHDEDILKLKRYASIESTIIRIAIAAGTAIGIMLLISK